MNIIPYLSALHINGSGVEVIHADVALRADGVGHGSRVLSELTASQTADI